MERACTLHAHLVLVHRNLGAEDWDLRSVSTFLSSVIYLQNRRSWGSDYYVLPMPEGELFQVHHRTPIPLGTQTP